MRIAREWDAKLEESLASFNPTKLCPSPHYLPLSKLLLSVDEAQEAQEIFSSTNEVRELEMSHFDVSLFLQQSPSFPPEVAVQQCQYLPLFLFRLAGLWAQGWLRPTLVHKTRRHASDRAGRVSHPQDLFGTNDTLWIRDAWDFIN